MDEAMDAGRQLAAQRNINMVIRRPDGTVRAD
ncbi:MAG: DUF2188 domain-containing protein [Nitriliruptorales bacterium]|nr:DUF2188 domain-containing protein [Nitriliruptorales bacterium]